METKTTLTDRRRSLDMSLGELARSCGLGTSVMSRIERGLERPPEDVLRTIADKLNCTLQEVIDGMPSAEDAAKNYERCSDMLLAFAAVREDAKAHRLGKGKGGRGMITCPICKSILNYSVAGLNGHIWGACSTRGCVQWMQ